MSLPSPKFEPVAAAGPPAAARPPAKAPVVPLPGRRPPASAKAALVAARAAANLLPPLLTLLTLGLVWQIAAGGDSASFPSPTAIWRDSRELIVDPFFRRGGIDQGLFWHVATSLSRVGVGFGFAAAAGIALGVLVGASLWAHRGLDPLFQVLRTVPPLAWLPIALAVFHEAQPSALFVIFITSIWPIVINTAVGVRNIPQDYVNVARVLKLGPAEYFLKILLPATAPYIFTGLRIGVGMSWLAIIASEMLLGGVGIGFFIWDCYNSSRVSDIVVALIWVGLVGFCLDRFVALMGRLISRGTAAS